jgi:hypothetical protein
MVMQMLFQLFAHGIFLLLFNDKKKNMFVVLNNRKEMLVITT